MPGLDPISMASSGLQSLVGIGQTIGGMIQNHRATKKLEDMANNYKPNASIMDYYNKALSRYNVNPYNSAMYRMQTQNAQRNLISGINATQDRRGALASVGNLVAGTNDANLKTAAEAENEQGRNLSQLGGATQMKAAEDYKPFELKYNLLQAKAAGGANIMNAGIQNIAGGAGNMSNMYSANKAYGSGNSSYGGGAADNSLSQYYRNRIMPK